MLINEVNRLIEDTSYYRSFSEIANPYGDGKAASRIIEIIRSSCF